MELLIVSPESYADNPVTYAYHTIKGVAVQVAFRTGSIVREKAYRNDPSVYDFINRYWLSLSAEHQDRIFDVYRRIRVEMDRIHKGEFVDEELRSLCGELAALHSIENISKWVMQPGIIAWPDEKEAPRAYENAGSKKYPRDKTYLLSDYQNLLALILQLRPFTPIFAEYQEATGKNVSRLFVDIVRLRLLEDSMMPEGAGWKKLQEYTNAMLTTNSKAAKAAVMENMSAEDYPEWLFANVILRKLTIQSMRSSVPNDNSAFAVRHICCHILEQLRRGERDATNPSLKKEPSNSNESEERQVSRFEQIRAKETIPNGDKLYIQLYMQDFERLARELEPNIPQSLLNHFKNLYAYGSFLPATPQITMALWVLAPVISPRSEDDMSRVNMAQNIAVAAAVLWYRGHKELALIMSCHDKGEANMDHAQIYPSQRVQRAIYARLEELFPYQFKVKTSDKSYKPITDIVSTLVSEFETRIWEPTLPAVLVKDVSELVIGTEQFTMLRLPTEITELMLKMIIDIADRPLHNDPWKEADAIAKTLGIATTNPAAV